ncbi:MAG: hypothetical protein KF757_02035 [Phycisphaeraceae bacterium]|nr:hypothetical protein [Phycisphaeraceae bacterium]MCW5761991.1 hypothetical protein [Phycisphaeraceae bacterium]
MKIRCVQIALLSITTLALPASADAVFHIWIEAPAEVQAGSTFTASVWAEASGSILNEGNGAFNGFRANIMASGVSGVFSTARIPAMAALSHGTPSNNSLLDVIGWNDLVLGWISLDNPIHLFEVDITLEPSVLGEINLDVFPTSGFHLVTWWLNYEISLDWIGDSDPGSTRIITPATIRVIPAPGALAIVCIAPLWLLQRRRTGA